MDGTDVAAALGMQAHPEGGWYLETWRSNADHGARPAASAILHLLAGGERSRWHRVDADEIWQYSAGDPLELRVWSPGDAEVTTHRLAGGLMEGSVVQAVVPAGAWQAARPLGA